VVGGWVFFGLSEHFSKLANIQMSFNRPLEQHFYDPKSAKVNRGVGRVKGFKFAIKYLGQDAGATSLLCQASIFLSLNYAESPSGETAVANQG